VMPTQRAITIGVFATTVRAQGSYRPMKSASASLGSVTVKTALNNLHFTVVYMGLC